MALIRISQKDLCKLSGLKPAQVEPTLTSLGIPLEGTEGDELALEITPNRPDWLSVEGVARSCYSWRTAKPKLYKAALPGAQARDANTLSNSGPVHFILNASVRDVRPVLGSAIVHNVQLDENQLASLIQLQEKLHDTLGRGRRKMAIGLHDMAGIQPPFTYKAVGREEVRFVPLGRFAPMTPEQILLEHDKGREYAHLVGARCPLITDKNGEVLSFPPIINGERTRVGLSSHDLLIDCTGTSEETVRVTVNILAAALADRGAQIEEVFINSKPYSIFKPQVRPIPRVGASKLLGLPLDAPALIRHLARMGHAASAKSVHSPAFRSDILDEVDLIEDIAISIGYNELPMPLPSFGSISSSVEDYASLHEAALGFGYFEVMSWILTSEAVLKKSEMQGPALRVSNPLTEEFTTLRPWLYPNLLDILAHSKSEPLPIYLYEIGLVERPRSPDAETAPDFTQAAHLSAISTHPKSGFSENWAHLSGLARSMGVPLTLREEEIPGFIPGRCARVALKGESGAAGSSRVIGLIGEVHPRVLEAFGLEQPTVLFEVEADALMNKSAAKKKE